MKPAFVTILFSDLVGSTTLFDRHGDEVADAIRRDHFAALRSVIAEHNGREVKSTGDGLMVAFASAVAAMRCAIEMQHATTASESELQLRVGLDAGEPLSEGEDLYGTPVIVASRLCDAAGAGEILASEVVTRIAGARAPEAVERPRALTLKGIDQPVSAARILWRAPEPPAKPLAEPAGVGAEAGHALDEEAPIERERELAALGALVDATVAAAGRLLLIEGPAGIGKTLLLRELRRRAEARAVRVRTARGGELERDFGFGIVRQLFEPLLASGGRAEELFAGAAGLARPVFTESPDLSAGEASHAVLHGLYWLAVNLAESSPVILVVDDVHWSDDPSIRFLIHLAHRVEALPVGIAIASRTEDPAADDELQRALRAEASPPVLRLHALSADATERLVKARVGIDAAPELCAACHEASGGNPFLLSELLEELRASQAEGRSLDPDRVREIGPERIASALLMRIGRVGGDAPALARAVAVLGAEAELRQASELAEIPLVEARAVFGALRDSAILEPDEPLRFIHPIVRSAIYEDIPAPARAALHGRAAAVLAADGGEPEAVAVHLLATDVADERSAVATLRAAAEAAQSRGAPETASRYLRRCLREPLAEAERAGVLLELGRTERELGLPEAEGHLREAADVADDRRVRAVAADELGWAIGLDPEAQRELIPLFDDAAVRVRDEDRELALKIEARRLGALLLNPDHTPSFEEEAERFRDLAGETPAECALLGICARKVLLEGGTAGDVAELAARAARHLDLTQPGAHSIWLLSTILWLPAGEGLQRAFERRLSDAIETAGKRGRVNVFAWNSTLRASMRNLDGNLRGAEADARAALDSGGVAGAYPHAPLPPLVESLAEQGKTDEAEALLADHGLLGELPPVRPYTALLFPRARMHAVAGDIEAAKRDLDEALRRLEQTRSGGVSGLDTRLEAALIHQVLGDEQGAHKLSEQALDLARHWGAERAVGGALRVAGVVRGGPEGLELLSEAVEVLARSPATLWHAQALVDLGAALRRAGQRSAARERLAAGMDLAHACAAKPLVDRAHDELASTGARPRRFAQSGVDSLTPSERRVAGLAAEGMTNKQIAQALFVTLGTVEMHLSNTYRKLEIESRLKLPEALGLSSRA